MKNTRSAGLSKAFAAILISAVFILTVGMVASGWGAAPEKENSSDIGNNTENADDLNGDTENEDGTADNISNSTNEETIPEFTYYLTGLECESAAANLLPTVFSIDPGAPLYAIDGSEMVIEIPTENGYTRMLVFKSDTSALGKIGALAPTRDYMGALVKLFGGISVANGNDDLVNYSSIPSTLAIDLRNYTDCVYRENGNNLYTDTNLLDSMLNEEGIDKVNYKSSFSPFKFADFGKEIVNNTAATKISIPYGNEATELTYDAISGKYLLSKGERAKIDLLSGKQLSYKNAFVLFADTTTYDRSYGTQLVVETAQKGTGYYFTNGTMQEIRWRVDGGELIFENLNGNTLTVNRGNSYIAYYRSSTSNEVTFS